MKELSRAITGLPKSGIRVLQDAARKVPDCIRLETGEPDFDTPKNICEAADQAMKDGFTRYTAVPGVLSLRTAIADQIEQDIGIRFKESQIMVTGGATMALQLTLATIGNPGDEILVPDPSWPVYTMQVLSNHLIPVPYAMPADNGFEPRRENIESKITKRTKAIMVNTPSNPTGAVFSEQTCQMIHDLAEKYDLYIISDEIYSFLVYEGKHTSLAAMDKSGRTIFISGASKRYAMTGWRIGYAAASEDIIKPMSQLMVATMGNSTSVSQKAYESGILGPQSFVEKSVEEYRRRRDAVLNIFDEAGVKAYKPHGAFYILVDISSCGMADSEKFALALLDEEHVSVAPGGTFGASSSQMVRISYGTDMEDLCEGARRMCRFIKKHSK